MARRRDVRGDLCGGISNQQRLAGSRTARTKRLHRLADACLRFTCGRCHAGDHSLPVVVDRATGMDAICLPFDRSGIKPLLLGALLGCVPIILLVGAAVLLGRGSIEPGEFALSSLANTMLPALAVVFLFFCQRRAHPARLSVPPDITCVGTRDCGDSDRRDFRITAQRQSRRQLARPVVHGVGWDSHGPAVDSQRLALAVGWISLRLECLLGKPVRADRIGDGG